MPLHVYGPAGWVGDTTGHDNTTNVPPSAVAREDPLRSISRDQDVAKAEADKQTLTIILVGLGLLWLLQR